MNLTSIQIDRAIGAVLASAAGDALGSQYEFGPALSDGITPAFGRGVFGHARGEWTDDTSMAIPILDVLARGDRPDDAASREEIVARWIGWARTAKDVGAQTRSVLLQIPESFTEADVRAAARAVHERAGRSGGNGALMRTGPLALGYLDRPVAELVQRRTRYIGTHTLGGRQCLGMHPVVCGDPPRDPHRRAGRTRAARATPGVRCCTLERPDRRSARSGCAPARFHGKQRLGCAGVPGCVGGDRGCDVADGCSRTRGPRRWRYGYCRSDRWCVGGRGVGRSGRASRVDTGVAGVASVRGGGS